MRSCGECESKKVDYVPMVKETCFGTFWSRRQKKIVPSSVFCFKKYIKNVVVVGAFDSWWKFCFAIFHFFWIFDHSRVTEHRKSLKVAVSCRDEKLSRKATKWHDKLSNLIYHAKSVHLSRGNIFIICATLSEVDFQNFRAGRIGLDFSILLTLCQIMFLIAKVVSI